MRQQDDPVVGLFGDADHGPSPSFSFPILKTGLNRYEFQGIIAGRGGLSTGSSEAEGLARSSRARSRRSSRPSPRKGPSPAVPKPSSGPFQQPRAETLFDLLLAGVRIAPPQVLPHHFHSRLEEVESGAEAARS